MKLTIAEILQKAHNAKTKSQKVKILQENNSQALRSVLKWNFEPAVLVELFSFEVLRFSCVASAGKNLIVCFFYMLKSR